MSDDRYTREPDERPVQRDLASLHPQGAHIIKALKLQWPKTPYSLLTHPKVFEDAVAGIPQKIIDKVVAAFPQTKCGRESGLQPNEIYDLCKARQPQQKATNKPQQRSIMEPVDDLELAWDAVIAAYSMFHAGIKLGGERKTGPLITAQEVVQFVQMQKLPPDNRSEHEPELWEEANRLAFGELRRNFEELFGQLGPHAERYTHAYCGCANCQHEAKQFERKRYAA